jgi:hypothetical protein
MKSTLNDEDEELKILWTLIRFADQNRGFNRKFVDDIYYFYEERDFITYAQHDILKKIYYDNNVDAFFDELEEIHQREPNYYI